MVADPHVAVSPLLGLADHLLHAVRAVGPGGVDVQDPGQVLGLDQRGQVVRLGSIDLARVLAHFGRDGDEGIAQEEGLRVEFAAARLAVDQQDLNLLLGGWGESVQPPEWTSNWDGLVDQNELNALLGNWGTGAGAAAVPEPSTFALLGLAGLALLIFRRK